jgi:hypothetical protein
MTTEVCTKQKFLNVTDGAVRSQIARSAASGVHQYAYRCSICQFVHLATKYDGVKPMPESRKRSKGGRG